jgi:hypothetical protein
MLSATNAKVPPSYQISTQEAIMDSTLEGLQEEAQEVAKESAVEEEDVPKKHFYRRWLLTWGVCHHLHKHKHHHRHNELDLAIAPTDDVRV